ncbi:MAG: hypothetical protein WBN23_14410 [Woeseia sp.]
MKSEIIITEGELPADVVKAIKGGRKLVAIKILQETTGIGMANAKVLVDRASAKLAPRPPRQVFMKDYYHSANARLLGMVLALTIVFAIYRYINAT